MLMITSTKGNGQPNQLPTKQTSMKYNVKKISDLLNAYSSIYRIYLDEIEDNLKKAGHPLSVQDDENNIGIRLTILDDDAACHCVIDQIKYENENIMVHQKQFCYRDCDEWINLSYLGDVEDYVLESIVWHDEEELQIVDGDTHQGEANLIYSFTNIELFFIYEDGRIEIVPSDPGIDYYIGISGNFAVEKDKYEEAIRQVEEHELGIDN